MGIILFFATLFLAYSNGANDNFKGVATLFGSKTANYKTAIWWATITTFCGSISSIFLAQTLLKKFSGKGLVPDSLVGSESFILAIAIGAGVTVILATLIGFPVSTTHGLTGAMIGSGLVAVGNKVNFSALGKGFFLPLILSPILAIFLGGSMYFIFRLLRLRFGVPKELCVCVGATKEEIPLLQPGSVLALPALPTISLSLDKESVCAERFSGNLLGMNCQKAMDGFHFFSAGIVGFARGLNDTPKIAALLLLLKVLEIRWGMAAVALGMAVGGLFSARKVAQTMSVKITALNSSQGLSANLATGFLVILASGFGLPVSTTHVSVGSLFGIGLVTKSANSRVMANILFSWVLTLPCAAAISATVFWALR